MSGTWRDGIDTAAGGRVLELFEELSRIPRDSGKEAAVSNWIRGWAQERRLTVRQDALWNLIITKPASAGYEDHPPVLLQAHMDMVCEKDNDSGHDFEKDPVTFRREGDWIMSATGTTLGADNGVGMAAAMAVLEDDSLPHPPLEVVFTVQEETTFAGAESVDVSGLRAKRMINLDHADERELIVGSCGGTGVRFTMPLQRADAIPEGHVAYRIRLGGLRGGHSGEDIHRGRGNAISLLLRVLEEPALKVVSITGGTNRLAIPREAEAVVWAADEASLRGILEKAEITLRKEYSTAAPELEITMEPAVPADAQPVMTEDPPAFMPPLTDDSFAQVAAVVRLYPNGIAQMNGSFDGLVESSDNIGIISTDGDVLELTSEVRGAYQSTVEDITRTIDTLAAMVCAKTEYFNGYVPWEFEASSPLRSLAASTFEGLFGSRMRQLALHAGLECGFFAEKISGLDMISIGPDCQNFHSPQERVSISSTGRFYQFLKALLQKM